MHIYLSVHDQNAGTRSHPHNVTGEMKVKVNADKSIEIIVSEQNEDLKGKRKAKAGIVDDDVRVVNYVKTAVMTLRPEDIRQILQVALDYNMLSVQLLVADD